MFGYVNINKEELSPEAFQRYRAFYCGLCSRLQALHGVKGRCTLSYDMTFLTLLLTSLYEPECSRGTLRCPIHPTKPHPFICNTYTDYAADMSLELAYRKLLDDWDDDHNRSSLMLANSLKKKHEEVSQCYPRQAAALHLCLSRLRQGELEGSQDPDAMSSHFGAMMAELLNFKRDEWSEPLQQMGMALGKFIYLMDAYADLEKDLKKGRYNPLKELAKKPDYEENCREVLTLLMSQCAAAFERLPILENADILRNILYSGVWMQYHAIYASHQAKAQKQKGTTP